MMLPTAIRSRLWPTVFFGSSLVVFDWMALAPASTWYNYVVKDMTVPSLVRREARLIALLIGAAIVTALYMGLNWLVRWGLRRSGKDFVRPIWWLALTLSLVAFPVIFMPLHYIIRGYLTRFSNITWGTLAFTTWNVLALLIANLLYRLVSVIRESNH